MVQGEPNLVNIKVLLSLIVLSGCGSQTVQTTNPGNPPPLAFHGTAKIGEPVQVEVTRDSADSLYGSLHRPAEQVALSGSLESDSGFFATKGSNNDASEVLGFIRTTPGAFYHISRRTLSFGHLHTNQAATSDTSGKVIDISQLRLSHSGVLISEPPIVLASFSSSNQSYNENQSQENNLNNLRVILDYLRNTTSTSPVIHVIINYNPFGVSAGVFSSLLRNSAAPEHSIWHTGSAARVSSTPVPGSTAFDFVIEGMEPVSWSENHATGTFRLEGRFRLVER